jgi:hypothetical protein
MFKVVAISSGISVVAFKLLQVVMADHKVDKMRAVIDLAGMSVVLAYIFTK